jgi:hypothetical protein
MNSEIQCPTWNGEYDITWVYPSLEREMQKTRHVSVPRLTIVHLYVGHSEEEYKEANESLRLNRVFLLLVSPLCITGLIGDQDLGSPGRVLSLFGFLSNIAYITLSLYR